MYTAGPRVVVVTVTVVVVVLLYNLSDISDPNPWTSKTQLKADIKRSIHWSTFRNIRDGVKGVLTPYFYRGRTYLTTLLIDVCMYPSRTLLPVSNPNKGIPFLPHRQTLYMFAPKVHKINGLGRRLCTSVYIHLLLDNYRTKSGTSYLHYGT